jgi:excinuclease UvrABC ATPase subunit
MPAQIVIRGARVHNLKNLDLEIPRDRLVVITGPSGSGKSSLAFDTLYAEGRRRYLEAIAADAHQLLQQIEKPDVDSIEGISPTIAIRQNSGVAHSRSTVGTMTTFMIFCACCLFEPVNCIVPIAAVKSSRRAQSKSSINCFYCRMARAWSCWRRWRFHPK